MNAVAGFLGWFMIWTVVATVAAVVLGKCLKFVGREQPSAPGPEDWEPAPRTLTPMVPHSWQLTEEQLREIESRDTRTPSDPAS